MAFPVEIYSNLQSSSLWTFIILAVGTLIIVAAAVKCELSWQMLTVLPLSLIFLRELMCFILMFHKFSAFYCCRPCCFCRFFRLMSTVLCTVCSVLFFSKWFGSCFFVLWFYPSPPFGFHYIWHSFVMQSHWNLMNERGAVVGWLVK